MLPNNNKQQTTHTHTRTHTHARTHARTQHTTAHLGGHAPDDLRERDAVGQVAADGLVAQVLRQLRALLVVHEPHLAIQGHGARPGADAAARLQRWQQLVQGLRCWRGCLVHCACGTLVLCGFAGWGGPGQDALSARMPPSAASSGLAGKPGCVGLVARVCPLPSPDPGCCRWRHP